MVQFSGPLKNSFHSFGEFSQFRGKFHKFWMTISREIICQNLPLLALFFTFPEMQCCVTLVNGFTSWWGFFILIISNLCGKHLLPIASHCHHCQSCGEDYPSSIAVASICFPEQKRLLGPTLRAVIHTLAVISTITLIILVILDSTLPDLAQNCEMLISLNRLDAGANLRFQKI